MVHKWHYENHNKLNEAFNDNKFGFHTLVTFYPSGVWLTNNFHNATELDEKGIEWSKQVSYSDFAEMMCNGNIENQHLYDWDDDV